MAGLKKLFFAADIRVRFGSKKFSGFLANQILRKSANISSL